MEAPVGPFVALRTVRVRRMLPPTDAPGPGTTTSAPTPVTGGDPPIVTDKAPASSPAPAPTLAPIDSDSDSAKWNHPSVVVGLLWMTVWTVIAKMMNTG
jgi:hypothetical protein